MQPRGSAATSATKVSETTMAEQSPQVGIVMGSDSDWPTMQAAADVLDEFGVRWEADVRSAHRMPREMLDYGATAARHPGTMRRPGGLGPGSRRGRRRRR